MNPVAIPPASARPPPASSRPTKTQVPGTRERRKTMAQQRDASMAVSGCVSSSNSWKHENHSLPKMPYMRPPSCLWESAPTRGRCQAPWRPGPALRPLHAGALAPSLEVPGRTRGQGPPRGRTACRRAPGSSCSRGRRASPRAHRATPRAQVHHEAACPRHVRAHDPSSQLPSDIRLCHR